MTGSPWTQATEEAKEAFEQEALQHMDALYRTALRMAAEGDPRHMREVLARLWPVTGKLEVSRSTDAESRSEHFSPTAADERQVQGLLDSFSRLERKRTVQRQAIDVEDGA